MKINDLRTLITEAPGGPESGVPWWMNPVPGLLTPFAPVNYPLPGWQPVPGAKRGQRWVYKDKNGNDVTAPADMPGGINPNDQTQPGGMGDPTLWPPADPTEPNQWTAPTDVTAPGEVEDGKPAGEPTGTPILTPDVTIPGQLPIPGVGGNPVLNPIRFLPFVP